MGEPVYRLKVRRAEKHLQEVHTALSGYQGQHPCVAIRDLDGHPDALAYRAKISQLPDPYLPLVIGDCVHNLRVALDYGVIALAAGVYARDRFFPMYVEDIWALDPNTGKEVKGTANLRKRFRAAIDGLHPEAATFIEGMQPYKRGADAQLWPLAFIAGVDNADKHQELTAVAFGIEDAVMTIRIGGSVLAGTTPKGTVEDGGGVARFTRAMFEARFGDSVLFDQILTGQTKADVEIQGTPKVAVERTQVVGRLVLPQTLDDLVRLVGDILDTFEQWFP